MAQAPESVLSFNLRLGTDLQIAITKILNVPMLADASEVDRSLICTIASELGTNILKYAGSGTIQIKRFNLPDFSDIEIKAIDEGPGIQNVDLAMVESFSSGGTLGLGLPGVKRIANKFSIDSDPGRGTTVMAVKRIRHTMANINHNRFKSRYSDPDTARIDRHTREHLNDRMTAPITANMQLDLGVRIRCCYGQSLSGDQVCISELKNGFLIAIIDVTGHGPAASALAIKLSQFIKANANEDLPQLMRQLHQEAEGTVGASVGLAYINTHTAQIDYLGVGNTSLVLLSDKNWRPISKNGVVGLRLSTPLVQTNPFSPDDILIMHTDGLSQSILSKELGTLRYKNSESIANMLVDLSGKKYDDATCMVAKWMK